MHREHYMVWFVPVLAIGAAVGFVALIALRRLAAPAVALTFLLVLVAPTAYATTTWLAPVEGTFAAAGPRAFAGPGGYGVDAHDLAIDRAMLDYVSTHNPGSRWALLTVAADTGSPMILMGLSAGALGGYSGTDPAVDGPQLARMVASGQARYVLLGGEYSLRGGNHATQGGAARLQGAGAVAVAQPDRLPLRPGAVRLRRRRAGARGGGVRLKGPDGRRAAQRPSGRHRQVAVERAGEQLALAAGRPARHR